METFDYIIVGAGSAGCVLAHRLTEDGQHRVLLLEAGVEDKEAKIAVPAAFYKLFKTEVDWDLQTEPQENMGGRRLYQPRGKTLGGSSSINAMLYIRGHRADYDAWAAAGNPGWSYEEVLPYFKKSEQQSDIHNEYHGENGPLHVGHSRYYHPLSNRFIEAGVEMGYPRRDDFNGAEQEGFGLLQSTTFRGRRASTARTFLKAAYKRANLSVRTQAQVLRIDTEEKRATGVTYLQQGQEHSAKAHKGVILSAGAFHSPHVLLLSGIGPGAHLQKHGIKLVHDLPGVGQNLQDHIVYPICFTAKKGSSLDSAERFPGVIGNLTNYLLRQRGPFTSTVAEAAAFIKSAPDLEAPDLQFHFGPAMFLNHGFTRPKGNGYTIGPTLLTPYSRGSVSLADADPHSPPSIDPCYLDDDRDLERLIYGGRIGQQLGESQAFAKVRTGMYQPHAPLITDQQWSGYIRENAQIIYHPVGTCKMGNDSQAVVDAQLRVHGMQGLRVIDASIMPTVTRGNTNAPTIMIAERGAALLTDL
jgi:choline dehydrogenase